MVGQFEGLRSAVDEMNWVSKFDARATNESDGARAMEPSLTGPMEGGVFFRTKPIAIPLCWLKL